jgi:hypothetical protein
MTEFIDLIYCSGLDDGQAVLAYAPFGTYIGKGDIVCIDGMTDFYMVTCHASVSKEQEQTLFFSEEVCEKIISLEK